MLESVLVREAVEWLKKEFFLLEKDIHTQQEVIKNRVNVKMSFPMCPVKHLEWQENFVWGAFQSFCFGGATYTEREDFTKKLSICFWTRKHSPYAEYFSQRLSQEIKKNDILEKEILRLEKENAHLRYSPGAEGYLEAQKHFESLSKPE